MSQQQGRQLQQGMGPHTTATTATQIQVQRAQQAQQAQQVRYELIQNPSTIQTPNGRTVKGFVIKIAKALSRIVYLK